MAFTPVITGTTGLLTIPLTASNINTYYKFLVDTQGLSDSATVTSAAIVAAVKADIGVQMSIAYYGVEASMSAKNVAAAAAAAAPAIRVLTVL